MTSVLTDEGWTKKDLEACTSAELRELIAEVDPYADAGMATKADMVAFLLGHRQEMKPTAEAVCAAMLREATQLRSWVRGVPPPLACLKAEDKRDLTMYDVPAIMQRAA